MVSDPFIDRTQPAEAEAKTAHLHKKLVKLRQQMQSVTTCRHCIVDVFDHIRSHRVEHDVARQFQKVRVPIHQDTFVGAIQVIESDTYAWRCPQSRSAFRMGPRLLPFSVRRYSNLGGCSL